MGRGRYVQDALLRGDAPSGAARHQSPTTFTFVTGGIDDALQQAQHAAAGKHVNVMGAELAQQLLRAGRIDEIQLNLVPVLLGDGARLFDRLGAGGTELERLAVIPTATVTHLRYRVLR
jgi:dihydrofolate reductase